MNGSTGEGETMGPLNSQPPRHSPDAELVLVVAVVRGVAGMAQRIL